MTDFGKIHASDDDEMEAMLVTIREMMARRAADEAETAVRVLDRHWRDNAPLTDQSYELILKALTVREGR